MKTRKVFAVSFGFSEGIKIFHYYDLDQLKQDILVGDLSYDFIKCKNMMIQEANEILEYDYEQTA